MKKKIQYFKKRENEEKLNMDKNVFIYLFCVCEKESLQLQFCILLYRILYTIPVHSFYLHAQKR